MSHVPHELADEFPNFKEEIRHLKMSDAHFSRLFDDYHVVNREIHRAEAAGLNISDDHYLELKRQRMTLKDELFSILQQN